MCFCLAFRNVFDNSKCSCNLTARTCVNLSAASMPRARKSARSPLLKVQEAFGSKREINYFLDSRGEMRGVFHPRHSLEATRESFCQEPLQEPGGQAEEVAGLGFSEPLENSRGPRRRIFYISGFLCFQLREGNLELGGEQWDACEVSQKPLAGDLCSTDLSEGYHTGLTAFSCQSAGCIWASAPLRIPEDPSRFPHLARASCFW